MCLMLTCFQTNRKFSSMPWEWQCFEILMSFVWISYMKRCPGAHPLLRLLSWIIYSGNFSFHCPLYYTKLMFTKVKDTFDWSEHATQYNYHLYILDQYNKNVFTSAHNFLKNKLVPMQAPLPKFQTVLLISSLTLISVYAKTQQLSITNF